MPYIDRAARFEPDLAHPDSMLLRLDLEAVTDDPLGNHGPTIHDVLRDWRDAREKASPEARDAGDNLARFADEVNGLLK